jgi:hypothetical protein
MTRRADGFDGKTKGREAEAGAKHLVFSAWVPT